MILYQKSNSYRSCLVHDILGERIANFCHLRNTEKITLDIIEKKNEIKFHKKISSNPDKYSKVIAINTNKTRVCKIIIYLPSDLFS